MRWTHVADGSFFCFVGIFHSRKTLHLATLFENSERCSSLSAAHIAKNAQHSDNARLSTRDAGMRKLLLRRKILKY